MIIFLTGKKMASKKNQICDDKVSWQNYTCRKNLYTLGICNELSKAFDTADHKKKILENFLEWFKSYLENRK